MSIRDRIAQAISAEEGRDEVEPIDRIYADAVLAACPEIAALDHAREAFRDPEWPHATPPRPAR